MIAGAVLTDDGHAVACIVPLPDRCAARADWARDRAESAGVIGQSTDLATIARRMAWDAHAAAEYPRPLMSDAIDLARAFPAMSQLTWHLVAGACIIGPGCDCQPPAHHRDALVELAVITSCHALRTLA